MTSRNGVTAAVIVVLGAFLVALPDGRASSDEIQEVAVVNFPDLQQVAGTVFVEGPVRHATLQSLKEILVSPVDRERTTRLINGGVLETDGFTSVVLSLNGRTQGKHVRSGTVGAILVPDEETVVRAFDEEGLVQFPLEVSVSLSPEEPSSFASDPKRLTIAFPRYRVLLYNTGNRTATVNLFAYLSN